MQSPSSAGHIQKLNMSYKSGSQLTARIKPEIKTRMKNTQIQSEEWILKKNYQAWNYD